MGMLGLDQGPGLPLEAQPGARVPEQVGAHELDGHAAPQGQVLGLVDRAHAALPQPAHQPVAAQHMQGQDAGQLQLEAVPVAEGLGVGEAGAAERADLDRGDAPGMVLLQGLAAHALGGHQLLAHLDHLQGAAQLAGEALQQLALGAPFRQGPRHQQRPPELAGKAQGRHHQELPQPLSGLDCGLELHQVRGLMTGPFLQGADLPRLELVDPQILGPHGALDLPAGDAGPGGQILQEVAVGIHEFADAGLGLHQLAVGGLELAGLGFHDAGPGHFLLHGPLAQPVPHQIGHDPRPEAQHRGGGEPGEGQEPALVQEPVGQDADEGQPGQQQRTPEEGTAGRAQSQQGS